jgi:hypothetical protein
MLSLRASHGAPFVIRSICGDLAFDSHFVVSPPDAEISLFTPVWIPRICHLPVGHTILRTPANKADGVSTQSATRHVVIDTAIVVLKVSIDRKGGLDRALGHNRCLNIRDRTIVGHSSHKSPSVARINVVGSFCVSVASGLAGRRALRRAARSSLRWIWIITDWAVVMAVREREGAAETTGIGLRRHP